MNTIHPTRKMLQRFAWLFIVLMINQIAFPVAALALTAGPSQPEVKSFEPAGTTEMVNLFSGDFTYNVPLLEVPGPDGGYPINLFYNSVTSMEQEASWTGLGWNINVGSLSRGMRGVPDDFNGEQISRKLDMRKSETTVVGTNVSAEVAGFDIASFGLSLGINYVYNSYKGAGFSIDPMINLGVGGEAGEGEYSYGVNLSLGFNASTIDAGSANVGFSLSGGEKEGRRSNLGYNLSFDAKGNHDHSLNLGGVIPNVMTILSIARGGGVTTGSGTVSFAKRSYTPSVTIPWTGSSFSWDLSFTPGGTVVYSKLGLRGSYSEQYIKDGGLWQSKRAFGYNYLQEADKYSLLDFNREKDGAVHRHQRYLANPIMTHDVYSVTGQGIGGSFRAHRSDYGFLHDPYLLSSTIGGTIGGEAGPAWEFGLNAAVTFKDQVSNNWPYIDWVDFKKEEFNSAFEPYFYKMTGDVAGEKTTTYDYLGAGEARDKPLRLKREGFDYSKWNGGELEAEDTNTGNAWSNNGSYSSKVTWNSTPINRSDRKPRNTSVQPITNELLMDNGNEILPEFDIKVYAPSERNNYDPVNGPAHNIVRSPTNSQNAAFTVLGQDGVRWNYGLPVYNKSQIDAKFSVEPAGCTSSAPCVLPASCAKRVDVEMEGGDRNAIDYIPSGPNLRSNDLIDEQKIPQYAHTHLLTSVLGTDYGDIDGIPGPSDNDVGYWMKTNYVKLSDNYQWRAPFVGANYAEGYENSPKDDLGAFMWGEREVYLPATVETKTHIAVFDVSKRYDARGAEYYIQNASDLTNGIGYGEYSYKLDRVRLFSKSDIEASGGMANATPLKTVHFTYDYSLCSDVENNKPTDATAAADNAGITIKEGKLTLKSVHFTYENSDRGELSPYKFEYSNLNPSYDDTKMDRWGAYRSDFLQSGYSICDNMKLPYTNQDAANKANLDADIAAWHLKKIFMPSGSVLNLEMERDDYAYVQDAQVTKMFKIVSTSEGDLSNITSNLELQGDPQPEDRVIQIELEEPISTQAELNEYINDLPEVSRFGENYKQLYYRIRIDLRNSENPTEEYVNGYCEIDKNTNRDDLIEFEPTSLNTTTGKYSRANITLKNSRIQVAGKTHHPMAMTSWDFLRDNLPDKMLATDLGGPPDAMTSLDQIGENINSIFTGFFKYCRNNNFAQIIDLEKSYVRLNSPRKRQYGGGIRVKEIRLDDGWNTSESSTLGVVYDYTTTDEEGKEYSSGVLENEIAMGYDECPLRWAVIQEEIKDGKVRDIHKYEYPMNEGYYPGAAVGYSKVSVRSLASNYALLESRGQTATIPGDLIGKNFGTTGETVYDYYTAKDFPIITNKTSLDDTETNPWANMLLESFAGIRLDHYTGTQGYSIQLNDMHGKTRKIATYGQLPDGSMSPNPLTEVEYKYKTKEVTDFKRGKPNQQITILDNEVEVLLSDGPEELAATTEIQLLGVDYEFFIDGREALQTGGSGGLQFNADYVPPWFVLPFPWPTYSYHENRARTSVSNKIIMRSGILEEVHAFDGQAHIVTKNKVFDGQTGSPVLATVENQLGGEIYNYSIPAYMAHSTMGAASKNWGHSAEMVFNGAPDICTGYYTPIANTSTHNLMVPGDEFIATIEDVANTTLNVKTKVIYMGDLLNSSGVKVPQYDIENVGNLSNPGLWSVKMKNTRSGNRNLVGATIAQYSTVDTDPSTANDANPLINRTAGTDCSPMFVNINVSNNIATLTTPAIPTPVAISPVEINNVLSASAADFSEDWTMEYYDYRNTSLENTNPYTSGIKGVWKAKSSYAYVDNRETVPLAISPQEVDIRESGVVNGVALFNWENPFVEYCTESNWVRTQDITKYRLGGQSVESRDVLGNYQAALYGYNDNLVTAQGVNTTFYELGYEGFEEPNQAKSIQDVANNGFLNTGNIDILPKDVNLTISDVRRHENYRLTYPMAQPVGSIARILVRKPFDPNVNLNAIATLHLQDKDNSYSVDAQVVAQYPLDIPSVQRLKVAGLTHLIDENTEDQFTVYELDFSQSCNAAELNQSDWWAGDVSIKHQTLISKHTNNTNDVISSDYAHTGKYSLKLNRNSPSNDYTQNILRLQNGADYVLSAWIRVVEVDGNNEITEIVVPTYANGIRGIEMEGVLFEPAGPIIEGWQRIEGTFTHNSAIGGGIPILKFISQAVKFQMYVDDIRIFPADGNMVSYVYDPIDYKLRATLDDNNYATFYIYDESGSLISTKRETERGIISIQESRSHVEPTN